MEVAQFFAIIIFIFMFLAIVTDKIERHIVTLACGSLMLVLVFGICMKSFPAIWDTLNFKSFLSPFF